MAAIIDGKAVSARLRQEMKGEVAALQAKGITPGLAVVLVGEDPASQVYVRNKIRACEELGIRSQDHRLPADTTQERLLELIGELNGDPAVHGILVQLPLPKQISDQAVIAAIDPKKDVDAFHPQNVGKIVQGNYDFLPCTPAGVMALLRSTGVPVAGKECVVIGRSNIVGKPMALLMLHEHATVTICHSRTRDLAEVCRRRGVQVILDISARRLPRLLGFSPLLIKPNDEEVREIWGMTIAGERDAVEVLDLLHGQGARNVLLTLGEKGLYFSDGDGIWYCDAPRVELVSSACAGDACLAAFLSRWLAGAGLEEALKLASATGGDVAGSAGIGSLSRVTGYLPGLTVKTVRPGKDKSI